MRCSRQPRCDGEGPQRCPSLVPGRTPPPPPHIDMYIIQSYPEQHNTLKKIYSYIQYL